MPQLAPEHVATLLASPSIAQLAHDWFAAVREGHTDHAADWGGSDLWSAACDALDIDTDSALADPLIGLSFAVLGIGEGEATIGLLDSDGDNGRIVGRIELAIATADASGLFELPFGYLLGDGDPASNLAALLDHVPLGEPNDATTPTHGREALRRAARL